MLDLPQLTLYTKAGCHLCSAAREALLTARATAPFHLREVDIALDPELFEEHRWDIPVIEIDGQPAFKLRVTPEQIIARLRP